MLYRKIGKYIEQHLLGGSDKILLIEGARQIGKSFIIREIGIRLFQNCQSRWSRVGIIPFTVPWTSYCRILTITSSRRLWWAMNVSCVKLAMSSICPYTILCFSTRRRWEVKRCFSEIWIERRLYYWIYYSSWSILAAGDRAKDMHWMHPIFRHANIRIIPGFRLLP